MPAHPRGGRSTLRRSDGEQSCSTSPSSAAHVPPPVIPPPPTRQSLVLVHKGRPGRGLDSRILQGSEQTKLAIRKRREGTSKKKAQKTLGLKFGYMQMRFSVARHLICMPPQEGKQAEGTLKQGGGGAPL